jgi:hypothetical protein
MRYFLRLRIPVTSGLTISLFLVSLISWNYIFKRLPPSTLIFCPVI